MAPKKNKSVRNKKLPDSELEKIAGGGVGGLVESAHFFTQVRDVAEHQAALEEKPPAAKLDLPEALDGFEKATPKAEPIKTEATAASTAVKETEEQKEVKLSLGEIYKIMTMGKPIDAVFAKALKAVTSEAQASLEALPDHYEVDGKLQDGGARKQSVIDLLGKLNGVIDGLQGKTTFALARAGASGALNIDGTIKDVLAPFVHTISQFGTEAGKAPAERLRAETEVTNNLTAWIKALPDSVLTEKKLKDYAGKLGNAGKSPEELTLQYRQEKLQVQTEVLTDSLQKLGLSKKAAAGLTDAITQPLEAGKSLAPKLLSVIASGISDPFNQALLGHVANFAAQVTSLLAPTKEKPIAFLSDNASKELTAIAEKNPELSALFGNLKGDPVARNEKMTATAASLKDLGAIFTGALDAKEVGQKEDPLHLLEKKTQTELSGNLAKDWEQASSANPLSRLWNSIKSTFSGKESSITQIGNLNQKLARQDISHDEYFNALSLIKQNKELPKWAESFVKQAQEKTLTSQDGLNEKGHSMGQERAVKVAETGLVKSVEDQRAVLKSIGTSLDDAETSIARGFTGDDRALIKNWLSRFENARQEKWQGVLVDMKKEQGPAGKMQLIDSHSQQVQQDAQSLQQIQNLLKEGINDGNYTEVMSKVASLAGIPESEVPKRIAQVMQEERANTEAMAGSITAREKVTDVKDMSPQQLSARSSELVQILKSPDFWNAIRSSDAFADRFDSTKFTSGDKKEMKAATEKYANKLVMEMNQAPEDINLQKRNTLALTRLKAQVEGVTDLTYKTVLANIQTALKE